MLRLDLHIFMSLLDKLPKLPFLKTSSQEEYYFALNIDTDKVNASIWGIYGKKLEIVNVASVDLEIDDDLESTASQSILIDEANFALDEALADFQPEPEKILFGVPDHWLQDDDLKEDRLKFLRRLVKELGISPMAYVSTSQAIAHFLQKQQGVPLTSILVKVADPLVVTVFKAGKNLGSKLQKRTERLPEDIEKALLSFADIEVLPSKILIYGKLNDKAKDELQSYSWMAQLPFLHLPKIEELPQEIIIEAVCLAGASELHPEVVYHPKALSMHTPTFQHSNTKALLEEEDTRIKETERHHHHKESKAEDLGFKMGDVEAMEENLREGTPEESFEHEQEWEGEHVQRSLVKEEASHYPPAHLNIPLSPIEKFKSLIAAPLGFLTKRNHHKSNFLTNKILIVALLLVLLIGATLVFVPKAKVTIFMDMKILEKESQVIADPKVTEVNEDQKIIPGKVVDVTISDSARGLATGKKKIGDPAKGKVVIYNKTSSSKTFSQGIVMTTPNNLKFVLDTSVQVASQSSTVGADFSTIIKPGKSDSAGASAQAIGPEGNISANVEMTVANFSADQVVARVDSAFTGGVSKDVTVVTSDDQKKLLATLTSSLRSKAQGEIQGKLTGDQKILAEALQEEVVKKTYSKSINDQAQDFSLDLNVRFKGTSYSDTDLKRIVSKLVDTSVTQGYDLDLSKTETQADVAKIESDGKLVFLAKFRAKLMPKLDLEKVKKEIIFKSPEQVAQQVRLIENVIGSNIELTPAIPLKFLQRTPILSKNITLEVTAK